jgi:hypothetical protein
VRHEDTLFLSCHLSTYRPSTGRRNSYEYGRADTCSPGYAQNLGWLESQNESWPQVVSTSIMYAWRTLRTGMIQYYETSARSSESIRRGKVADETAFLITHGTSMDAFFHLFKKNNQYIAWSFLRAIITPCSLNNFDRIVTFVHMKKLE